MKKRVGVVIFLILLSLILIASPVVAATPVANETGEMIIDEGQVVEEDILTAASIIRNHGVVQGDLVTAASEFEHTGEIQNDLILAAQNAELGGTIQGDARIAATDIQMTSQIDGNATIFARSFTQQAESIIKGSVSAFAVQSELKGIVQGDIRGYYEKLTINGQVKGDIKVTAEELILGPQAKVEGDIVYTSDLNLSQLEGSHVGGSIERKEPPVVQNNIEWEKGFGFIRTIGRIISLLSIMLVGVILTLIAPKKTLELGQIIQKKPLQVVGIGILGIILIPILGIFSILTIVGAPIGIILLVFYGLLIYLGRVALGMWIGQRILKKEKSPIYQVLLGILIIGIAGFIPYIGSMTKVAASIFGMGAILMIVYKSWKELKTNQLI